MKKRVASVVVCVLLAVSLVLTARFSVRDTGNEKTIVEEEETPLNDGGLDTEVIQVSPMDADVNVIPDKYNTGAKGSLTVADHNTTIDGVYFSAGGGNNRFVLDFCYANQSVTGTITFRNYDFSSYQMDMYHETMVDREIEVIFENCRFSTIYTGKEDASVKYRFINCTINGFSGSNASFERCAFGGSCTDGVVPFRNVSVSSCYFSDLAYWNEREVHSDGTQIYGNAGITVENVSFDRCRFEVPPIRPEGSKASINACIMLQMEYSGARNLRFTNCILNGGGYSLYARTKSTDCTIENALFDSIRVGCAKAFGTIYPDIADGIALQNIANTDCLYIGSVWRDASGTHLSVTNDTEEERTLVVYADNDIYTYTIPKCFPGSEITSKTVFTDYPFDLDIVIPKECEYVVCYDMSGREPVQIRFANWSNRNVTLSQEAVALILGKIDASKLENSVVAEGKCGENVEYRLYSDGTLVMQGSGETYNYHSGNLSPMNEYSKWIKRVEVAEGITKLGNQLFRNCQSIVEVKLPDGLVALGGNVFQGCSSLMSISLPASLQSIGNYCFSGTIVQTLDYRGEASQFDQMDIGSCNEMLLRSNRTQNEAVMNNPAPVSDVLLEGQCGPNVSFVLKKDGSLLLSGSGETYNYHSQKNPPWSDYASEIGSVSIGSGITGIGSSLFRGCGITEIRIPASVTVIGRNAFSGCSSLSVLYLPEGVQTIDIYAFNGVNASTVYAGSQSRWDGIDIGTGNAGICKDVTFEKEEEPEVPVESEEVLPENSTVE